MKIRAFSKVPLVHLHTNSLLHIHNKLPDIHNSLLHILNNNNNNLEALLNPGVIHNKMHNSNSSSHSLPCPLPPCT